MKRSLNYALVLSACLGVTAAWNVAAQKAPGNIQSITLHGATSDAATGLAVEVTGVNGVDCNMEIRRADGKVRQFDVTASAGFPLKWGHDDITVETLRKHATNQNMVAYHVIGVPTTTRPACGGRAAVTLALAVNTTTMQKKK